LHIVTQGDSHYAAAHTLSQVSGKSSTLYTHEGGLEAVAANGPLSIQAHTDQLELLADKEVTVVSVNDSISINAKTKIVLKAGQTSITLEGGNITFACPGTFSVKGSAHSLDGGASAAASLQALPVGKVSEPVEQIELNYHYDDLSAVVGAPYKVTFKDGTVREGSLDTKGYALLRGVPKGAYAVEYGEDTRPWKAPLYVDEAEFKKSKVQKEGQALIEKIIAREPTDALEGQA
jgi:type VI secretion system secreted protein VgrG